MRFGLVVSGQRFVAPSLCGFFERALIAMGVELELFVDSVDGSDKGVTP